MNDVAQDRLLVVQRLPRVAMTAEPTSGVALNAFISLLIVT
jgi:hypothetical protein